MNIKFFIVAALIFIPYTILWFFWHNNIFPDIYYTPDTLISQYPKEEQNNLTMNIANAVLVYGFVFFYYKSVKPDTSLIGSIFWGVYYTITVMGFFALMNYGIIRKWDSNILVYDLVWAVVGGILIGDLAFILYNKLGKNES